MLVQQLTEAEQRLNTKETEVTKEKDKISQQLILLEAKNQEIHD